MNAWLALGGGGGVDAAVACVFVCPSQLFVYQWHNEVLLPCAFYDAYVQAVSLNVVNDLVLFADVFKSVHFLRWKVRFGDTGLKVCMRVSDLQFHSWYPTTGRGVSFGACSEGQPPPLDSVDQLFDTRAGTQLCCYRYGQECSTPAVRLHSVATHISRHSFTCVR